MFSPAIPRPTTSFTRVAVCDQCQRVQQPDGRWNAVKSADFPPARRIAWDICDACCERYVKVLLRPSRRSARVR